MNDLLRRAVPVLLVGVCSLSVGACDTPRRGDEVSTAAGTTVGNLTGNRRDGITGEPIGTRPNYLIGVLADNRGTYADGAYRASYPVSRYPLASPTDRPGIVRSPFPPNNLIDVRRIPSGARVVDPSVNRVFTRP
ncbi:MAG: hypothetical protein ACO1QR_15870 [Chthoniobacteraceae bacterium]